MIMLTKPNSPSFTKQSRDFRWVERTEDGAIKGIHKSDPKVGYALALNPYELNQFQTEPITEILEVTKHTINFKTTEGEYKVYLPLYFKTLL